jgi:topoisomerase IA-like protein
MAIETNATAAKATTAKKPAAKKATTKKTTAKKTAAKKAPAKKLGKIIFEIDGQQIDVKAIEKKAAKLGGDVYVVAAEKKIFDKEGKSVDLF